MNAFQFIQANIDILLAMCGVVFLLGIFLWPPSAQILPVFIGGIRFPCGR